MMPLSRNGRIAILIVFQIAAALVLLYEYRSGRLASFGFWVAFSQFVLLVLGVATALFSEWVQKNKLKTLAAFVVIGLGGFYLTIRQSDQSAAETKELVGKLDRIEQSVLHGNPDKNQKIAEIRSAREAITSSPTSSSPTNIAPPSPPMTVTPTTTATPTPPPASASATTPIPSTTPTRHAEFLNYPSEIKMGRRSWVYAPPAGEYPIKIEARLAFHFEPNSLSHKELLVYIPATGEMPFVLQYVTGSAQKWAEEIERAPHKSKTCESWALAG